MRPDTTTRTHDAADSPACFLMELGRDLHESGAPADRLEEAMTAVAQRLGLEAQVFSTPTSIFAAVGEVGDQRTHLLRVEPGDVDLERLIRVDHVVQRVASGELSVGAGLRALDSIPAPSERWGQVTMLVATACASASAGVFFSGSLGDVVASGVAGLFTGALVLVGQQHRRLKRVLEALAGCLIAVFALFVARVLSPAFGDVVGGGGDGVWYGVNADVVTLSGVIVLLPGLTLTLAMSELANKHLVSGTGRLTQAIVVLLTVAFGVSVGRALGGGLPTEAVEGAGLPFWAFPVALVVGSVSFTVLFRARPVDLAVILVAGLVAFAASRSATVWLGPEIAVSVGALAVGLVANGYSRVFDMPSTVPTIPGIILLVPGSLGYRSIEALLSDDAVSGIAGVFATLLVAASLAVGLLLANVVLPERRLV